MSSLKWQSDRRIANERSYWIGSSIRKQPHSFGLWGWPESYLRRGRYPYTIMRVRKWEVIVYMGRSLAWLRTSASSEYPSFKLLGSACIKWRASECFRVFLTNDLIVVMDIFVSITRLVWRWLELHLLSTVWLTHFGYRLVLEWF